LFSDLNELSSVISACFPSSAAVLRLLVGADSVKLREGRVYIYVFIGILSIARYFLSNYRKIKKYAKVSFYIKKQAKITTSIPFYP
jgi:hypothetical protein